MSRSLPPIPVGQNPGGPWLLFSYLAEAERLGELYEQNHRMVSQAQENKPVLEVNQTKYPSLFSEDFRAIWPTRMLPDGALGERRVLHRRRCIIRSGRRM